MSLYRNLGPITFHSQSKACEIFTSQSYWIVQTSLSQQYSQELKKLSSNYNTMIGNQIIQCYSQKGKHISLIVDKFAVSQFDLTVFQTADYMCNICQALVSTFECIGIQNVTEIEINMFFTSNEKIFYLYVPMKQKSQKRFQENNKKISVCNAIVNFIETKSNFLNHLSNKLLLTKLRKCQNLSQMKDQLQYFQKIYEVGARKVKKQLKQQPKPQQFNDQIPTRPKHRLYRKRSQQFHEPMITNKYNSISQHKIECKKSLAIKNFHKYSHSTHSSSKRNFFSQRNKSLQPTHNKSSPKINQLYQTGRTQKSSQFLTTKSFSKGLFNEAKQNSKKKTKKGINSCSNYFFDTLSRNYPVESVIKQIDAKDKDNKICTRLQLAQSNIMRIPTEVQQIKDQNQLKEKINRNINIWKQRRNRNNVLMQVVENLPMNSNKFIAPSKLQLNTTDLNVSEYKEISKQIQHKQNKELINVKQIVEKQVKYNTKQIKTGEQNCVKLNSQKSGMKQINSVEEVRRQRIEARKQSKVIEQHIMDQLQQITLLPLNSKPPVSPKEKPHYKQKLVDQHKKRRDSLDNETTIRDTLTQPKIMTRHNKQHIQTKPSQKKVQQNNDKQFQKQKTARKKIKNNQQGQCVVENIRNKLEKIDLIAECVMKMQDEISNLKSGDKYLWQFPAFVFYKEFYIRRIQIQESLRQELLTQKQLHDELNKILIELQKQNRQAKQSLAKLLKVTLKKLKKYQFEQSTIEQSKKFLNLDLSLRWSKRVNETIVNFIKELEEIRDEDPSIMSFLIQVCESYVICKGEELNFQRRKGIDFANIEDKRTIEYFNQMMSKVR